MPFFAYLITQGRYGCPTPEMFSERLERIFEGYLVDYALYRDKENPEYPVFAEAFVSVCRAHAIRPMLHRDAALASRLGAFGVHLTSSQFEMIRSAGAAGLYTVISTHTSEEIVRAKAEGADAVTYSPVFTTPGKGAPKGLEDLNETAGKIDLPVIALGGIVTPAQVDAVKAAGAAGFASIRYFRAPFINSSKDLFCSK